MKRVGMIAVVVLFASFFALKNKMKTEKQTGKEILFETKTKIKGPLKKTNKKIPKGEFIKEITPKDRKNNYVDLSIKELESLIKKTSTEIEDSGLIEKANKGALSQEEESRLKLLLKTHDKLNLEKVNRLVEAEFALE